VRDWSRREPDCIHGLATTPRVETIADLAADVGLGPVLQMLQDEVFHGRLTLDHVRSWVGPGRRGSTTVAEACGHLAAGRESVLTVMVFDVALAARLPEPMCGADVGIPGVADCDLYWPDAGFVVEPRGYGPHGQRKRWYRDTRKEQQLGSSGLRVLPVTHEDATVYQGRLANMMSIPLADAGLIPRRLTLPPAYVLVPPLVPAARPRRLSGGVCKHRDPLSAGRCHTTACSPAGG
jgi:hypothetical protein